ncbi:MAG: Zn-ribbon domain-containing OB-fold protein [Acidimicrobiales bacterium]
MVSSGRGHVYSFVVAHHPQVPSFDYPLPVALVELEEGTRLVADLVDVAPGDVRIDMPVEVVMRAVDDELTLPMFRPAGAN